MVIAAEFEPLLSGRRIFVTGHTGFTGSWACLWLNSIDARVTGFSLEPDTHPALFHELGLAAVTETIIGDICDYPLLQSAMRRAEPEIVLHLAAQPLVRRSYSDPVRTFAVNAQGTAHVLEAARVTKTVRAVLCITTDKVYRNNEWPWPYREEDRLGGKDPYSASKSAAEMVIHGYSASFPSSEGKGPAIAIARGGNIVGGGDWSEDRLVPDFVRAVVGGTGLLLRYPNATRPWQHVLALVQGYLMLMAGLLSDDAGTYARAWNLGPADPRQYSVRQIIELLSANWRRPDLEYMDDALPEAEALALDSTLARNRLGWQPVWDTETVIAETGRWYREFYSDRTASRAITMAQLQAWRSRMRA